MSEAFYEIGGLRFWDEREIELREAAIRQLFLAVSTPLIALNRGWVFQRCEGPILTSQERLSYTYTDADIFTIVDLAGRPFCLRPETTPSSYEVARRLMAKGGSFRPPLCVWQAGKSFRRELNDGATAAKLRFNEFWQCEFQCIYAPDSKADYEGVVFPSVRDAIRLITGRDAFATPSDRLPTYSEKTTDIEVMFRGEPREMVSVSIRKDFVGMKVLEIAAGLDRLVEVAQDRHLQVSPFAPFV